MKLTQEQVQIRTLFREFVVAAFLKCKMWRIIVEVEEVLGVDAEEAYARMKAIPSIGEFGREIPISAYMAQRYPAVAQALFDNKPAEEVLALWATQKKANVHYSTKKRSGSDVSEMCRTHYNEKKMKAFAELNAHKGDRWQNTAWNIVK